MGGLGQTFKYQVTTGNLSATVTTLGQTRVDQNYTIGDSTGVAARLIIGVGNVGQTSKQATYTLYHPNTDKVTFRTVRYGLTGFG